MTAWHALHFGKCLVKAGVHAFRWANRLHGLGSGLLIADYPSRFSLLQPSVE